MNETVLINKDEVVAIENIPCAFKEISTVLTTNNPALYLPVQEMEHYAQNRMFAGAFDLSLRWWLTGFMIAMELIHEKHRIEYMDERKWKKDFSKCLYYLLYDYHAKQIREFQQYLATTKDNLAGILYCFAEFIFDYQFKQPDPEAEGWCMEEWADEPDYLGRCTRFWKDEGGLKVIWDTKWWWYRWIMALSHERCTYQPEVAIREFLQNMPYEPHGEQVDKWLSANEEKSLRPKSYVWREESEVGKGQKRKLRH